MYNFSRWYNFMIDIESKLALKIHWDSILITVTTHDHQGISNHQPLDCLHNSFFRLTSKETKNPHHCPFVRGIHWWIPLTKGTMMWTGQWLVELALWEGNPPVTGRAGPLRRVSTSDWNISWKHHWMFRKLWHVSWWSFYTLHRPSNNTLINILHFDKFYMGNRVHITSQAFPDVYLICLL